MDCDDPGNFSLAVVFCNSGNNDDHNTGAEWDESDFDGYARPRAHTRDIGPVHAEHP